MINVTHKTDSIVYRDLGQYYHKYDSFFTFDAGYISLKLGENWDISEGGDKFKMVINKNYKLYPLEKMHNKYISYVVIKSKTSVKGATITFYGKKYYCKLHCYDCGISDSGPFTYESNMVPEIIDYGFNSYSNDK